MKKVIFACVHNAGRSQIAAAFFNSSADRSLAHAVCAGTQPAERVHPEVVSAMREVGLELGDARPTRMTEALAAGATLLITMGCGDECPVVLGARRDDWPIEDPKAKPLEQVRAIREQIRRRVLALLTREGWLRSEAANSDDQNEVLALLAAAGLPTAGVGEFFPSGYSMVRLDRKIAAVAGLERHGDNGLLRSVAVAHTHRGLGFGGWLVSSQLEAARTRGLRRVYLLTTSAAGYFRALGFDELPRADAPAEIRATLEFTTVCPASAVCFSKSLR